MSDTLIAAIMNFAVEFGFGATKAFLAHPKASIEDAIAALDAAEKKSIDDYIREDAKARAAALATTVASATTEPPTPPPAAPPA